MRQAILLLMLLLAGCIQPATEPQVSIVDTGDWQGRECNTREIGTTVRQADVAPLVPAPFVVEYEVAPLLPAPFPDAAQDLTYLQLLIVRCQALLVSNQTLLHDVSFGFLSVTIKDATHSRLSYYTLLVCSDNAVLRGFFHNESFSPSDCTFSRTQFGTNVNGAGNELSVMHHAADPASGISLRYPTGDYHYLSQAGPVHFSIERIGDTGPLQMGAASYQGPLAGAAQPNPTVALAQDSQGQVHWSTTTYFHSL